MPDKLIAMNGFNPASNMFPAIIEIALSPGKILWAAVWLRDLLG